MKNLNKINSKMMIKILVKNINKLIILYIFYFDFI